MSEELNEYLEKVSKAFPRARPWILGEDGRTPVQTDLAGYMAWVLDVGGLSVRVAYDDLGDTEVSTVFIDQFGGFAEPERKPRLFETLVRSPEGEGVVDRYDTWEEAEEAHARIVAERVQSARRVATPRV
jgi:hypothetical protein